MFTESDPMVADPTVALLEKRFVEDAVVVKKVVEVALVAVRFARVVRPVTPRVPAKVPLPAVREPIDAVFVKRFVDDAVVLKSDVVVAAEAVRVVRVEAPVTESVPRSDEFPVVVAPPRMVRPPVAVPLPSVDDAVA